MDKLSLILSIGVPSAISIIGFITTYIFNKRNFQYEINKQKLSVNLDKIVNLPEKILTMQDSILKMGKSNASKNNQGVDEYKEIMSLIFAYGSKNANKIISDMQQMIYSNSFGNATTVEENPIIAYQILLICQLKYDISGIEISPDFWFRMRLSDYTKMKDTLIKQSNEIVRKLDLPKFLKID